MSPTQKKTDAVIRLVLTDIAAIGFSFFTAYHFRFLTGFLPVVHGVPAIELYTRVLLVIFPVYLWTFKTYGLYQNRRNIRRIEEIFLVIKAVSIAVLIMTAISFFYRGLSYSRIYLVTLWFFSAIFVSFGRYLVIQYEYRQRLLKKNIDKVLIIGADHNARSIIQWAKNNPHYGQEIIGVLARDNELQGKHIEGFNIIGASNQAEHFIKSLKPDIVILVDATFSRAEIADLVADCEDELIDFKVAADFYGLMSRSVDVQYVSRVPLLGFKLQPLDKPLNRILKRTFDLVATVLLMILSAPVWIFVILAIKFDDGGPVFYSQERVGRDQKVFNVLKFRTMKVDAEKETGPVWAKADDNRRTRMGDFLRRWNIDELPQFLNVLRGDMTLVGPRPERPHFVSQFRETIPRYMARHKIKSGITGWAQVNGYRGNTSIHERLKYDLHYMENWSLAFDVKILFMTLFAYKNAY